MKVCIGIVCIGDSYIHSFNTSFKPFVEKYCNKYGYDLRIFDSFIDPTNQFINAISFQKCLVPSVLMNYDKVIIMDADIWITEHTPPITSIELNGKIGIVDETKQVTPEEYLSMQGFAELPEKYYKLCKFEINTDKILNTGFIVCEPRNHAELLKSIYFKYINNAADSSRGFHYEQSVVGYELQINEMFTLIPNKWNHMVIYDNILKRQSDINKIFCLHFAGFGYINAKVMLELLLSIHIKQSFRRWGVRK